MEILYLFKDAVEQGLIWSLLALGVFISFRVLDFADLTVEGSVVLGGSVTGVLLLTNNPFFSNYFVVLIIAVLSGAAAGTLTGVLNTKLKIPAILAGIISMTALYSINLIIMKGASVYVSEANTIYTPLEKLFNNWIIVKNNQLKMFLIKGLTSFIVVSIFTIFLYWLFGTEVGMAIRAVGMNEQMAKAQGINTDKMIIIGLALSNALIALTGSLYTMSFKSSSIDIGSGTIIIGLASIIIGEAIFGNKTFKTWLVAIILGSILFQLLIAIATNLGFNANNLKLLQAILIAIVLSMPLIKKRFRKNKRQVI